MQNILKHILLVSFSAVLFSACSPDKNKIPVQPDLKDSLEQTEPANSYAPNDQSPLDLSYYPPDYPILKMNGSDTATLVARVIYSRPQKKGRVVFGYGNKCLREFGKEWRLGANEATEIEFFKPVRIAGKKINEGRYIIYCIPYPDKWTIIINSNLYTWGLHMDATKDIFKTDIPVVKQVPALESFTMVFEQDKTGANLIMAWDTVKATLPFQFSN